MATTTRPILNLADLPSRKRMQLEDQIMERAPALWRKRGHAHRNALNALLQAEREILAKKEPARFIRSCKFEHGNFTLKRDEH